MVISKILIPKELPRELPIFDEEKDAQPRSRIDKTLQRAGPAFNERQKSMFFDENGQFLDSTVYVLVICFYFTKWAGANRTFFEDLYLPLFETVG